MVHRGLCGSSLGAERESYSSRRGRAGSACGLRARTDLKAKLQLATEVKDSIEIVHTAEYSNFLKFYLPRFSVMLAEVPPQKSENTEHKLRNVLLEIINRLPHNEVPSPPPSLPCIRARMPRRQAAAKRREPVGAQALAISAAAWRCAGKKTPKLAPRSQALQATFVTVISTASQPAQR